MSLTFKCPSCRQELFVKDTSKAQTTCPYCQRKFNTPAAAVIEYGHGEYSDPKNASRRSDKPGISVSAFFLGFFGAVAVPPVSFYAMAWLRDNTTFVERWMVLAGVGAAIVAVIAGAAWLRQLANFQGIGRGVALGLLVGMIVMGPFALCYIWMGR